jgi:hypothetical protein
MWILKLQVRPTSGTRWPAWRGSFAREISRFFLFMLSFFLSSRGWESPDCPDERMLYRDNIFPQLRWFTPIRTVMRVMSHHMFRDWTRCRPESLKRYVSIHVKWLINGKQRTPRRSTADLSIGGRLEPSIPGIEKASAKLRYEFTVTYSVDRGRRRRDNRENRGIHWR